MKKQDLKTGMRIKTRNGDLYLVLRDCETRWYEHQDILFASFGDNNYKFLIGTTFNNDLIVINGCSEYDIMEVFTTKYGYCDSNVLDKTSLVSIWKREEKTEKEIEMEKLQEKINEIQEQYNRLKCV